MLELADRQQRTIKKFFINPVESTRVKDNYDVGQDGDDLLLSLLAIRPDLGLSSEIERAIIELLG
jgi:hypothetical protein